MLFECIELLQVNSVKIME